MAGNHKPARAKPHRSSVVERLAQSKFTKNTNWRDGNITLVRMRNNLPLGHEANRHKIEATFAPIEAALNHIEETGEIRANEVGQAVIWDEFEKEWWPLGPGLQNIARLFDLCAPQFGWEDQPQGLRRVGEKLETCLLLYPSDFKGARESIAWMREKIAVVTPTEWSLAQEAAGSAEDQA